MAELKKPTLREEAPPATPAAGLILPQRFGAREIMLIAVASEGFLLLLALLIAWLGKVELGSYLRPGPSTLPRVVAITALLLGINLVLTLLSLNLGWLRILRELLLRLWIPLTQRLSPGQLVVVAVLAGVCEELFFRGAVQIMLERSLGVWPAVALTGLLFGLLHSPHLGRPLRTLFVYYAFFGVVLSAIYVWSGYDLGMMVLIHGGYDLVALMAIRATGRRLLERYDMAAE